MKEDSRVKTALDHTSWSQLAGYFDGDGCISIRKASVGIPFTLGVALEFSDQSEMQIRMVKRFLESRGVSRHRIQSAIHRARGAMTAADGA